MFDVYTQGRIFEYFIITRNHNNRPQCKLTFRDHKKIHGIL